MIKMHIVNWYQPCYEIEIGKYQFVYNGEWKIWGYIHEKYGEGEGELWVIGRWRIIRRDYLTKKRVGDHNE